MRILFTLFVLFGSSTLAQETDGAGSWRGTIAIPGQELTVAVHLEEGDGDWRGTIDIPQQGATGLALQSIEVEGQGISFQIAGVPGDPTFTGSLEGDRIIGNFTQGPASFSFELEKANDADTPLMVRPQEPKPPFPYTVEEVTFDNGDVRLAGTLTQPRGEGPFPAVVFISGSGAQNRDEEIFGHKPFLLLADTLTRAGMATLRVDDRGVGGSTGSVATSTSEDFAEDALAGISLLRNRSTIAGDRVGLIGHSEGGLVAPIAASRSDSVAFIVLLAGPGVSGQEILELQLKLLSRAGGADSKTIERQSALQRQVIEVLKSDLSDDEVASQLRPLIRQQMESAPLPARPPADQIDAAIEAAVAGSNNRWMRAFVRSDPRPYLHRVRVPVLAINGSLDLQVDAEQNLPAIQSALAAGGNDDVTIVRLEGLNHLFQTADTGGVEEYGKIEETMAPEALSTIRDWLVSRFVR